jgi:histidine triad (HIT) family protein
MPEMKISEREIEHSEYDKILKGERSGVKVLHEDDKCLVFEASQPVAKTHLIVLAKSDLSGIAAVKA